MRARGSDSATNHTVIALRWRRVALRDRDLLDDASSRRRWNRLASGTTWAIFALVTLLGGCQSPDSSRPRTTSTAWNRADETRLGRAVGPLLQADKELSGVRVLPTGLDGFAARVLLLRHAERAVDLQTYILADDLTGNYLLHELLDAADRGVRVRLLVDDLNSGGMEDKLAALDAHTNVEVRLFNPFSRSFVPGVTRLFDYLMHPIRLDHRMHNKGFAVDGAVAIIGGRNIGDEYFWACEDVTFEDLDLVAIGPVVKEVGSNFDMYWSSDRVVPMEAWSALRRGADDLAQLRRDLYERVRSESDSAYVERVRSSDLVGDILGGRRDLLWAHAKECVDQPEKIVAHHDDELPHLFGDCIRDAVKSVDHTLDVVSPYFVPGEAGTKYLCELCARGVRVRILTNSLASTDVPAVHAGYSRYRRELLAGGVELYELQPAASKSHRKGHAGMSSKDAGLHAKTFTFDGKTVFVGSLNLDPRSIELNTEQGLVVESTELAEELRTFFEIGLRPDNTFRPKLEHDPENGAESLVWYADVDGKPVRFRSEPDSGFWKHVKVFFASILPIEGQI